MYKIKDIINKVHFSDCIDFMKKMPSNSIDTLICDPPYGLSFMGKKWDSFKARHNTKSQVVKNLGAGMRQTTLQENLNFMYWTQDWATEALRVLKPGGTALIFAGSRTQHLVAMGMELAGWTLKDCIMWLYGSGFPKATDISKQLDKSKGLKRTGIIKKDGSGSGEIRTTSDRERQLETVYETGEPVSDEAKLWNGWKSHGLKPAYEPIIWATKSLTFDKEKNILKEINNNLLFNIWLLLVKSQKQDMFKSQEMALTSLNTVLLWNAILGELWKNENKFTISTVSKTITELKILNLLLLRNTPESTDGKYQTYQNGIQKFQVNGFNLLVQFAKSCLEKEKKNIKDTLKAIAQENATWKLKDDGLNVLNVKKDLLPIILNANIVLLNVLEKLIIENERKELKEIVSFAEKSLKLCYQDQQNTVMSDVWLKDMPKISPNYSPIIVAMKPNEGSYAQNALKHGVSGLNIDGGRIGTEKLSYTSTFKRMIDKNIKQGYRPSTMKGSGGEVSKVVTGRFPANIILECICDNVVEGEVKGTKQSFKANDYKDETKNTPFKRGDFKGRGTEKTQIHTNPNCPCYILDKQSGELKSGFMKKGTPRKMSANPNKNTYMEWKPDKVANDTFGDRGGASRFFYIAKASKTERNLGCEELGEKKVSDGREKEADNAYQRGKTLRSNTHPTVKPLKLMEYLCTLTKTPTGGIVLDPFMGSGTTGIACVNTDREFIGIEKEKEYIEITKARIKKAIQDKKEKNRQRQLL